jgi:hypothetical protein
MFHVGLSAREHTALARFRLQGEHGEGIKGIDMNLGPISFLKVCSLGTRRRTSFSSLRASLEASVLFILDEETQNGRWWSTSCAALNTSYSPSILWKAFARRRTPARNLRRMWSCGDAQGVHHPSGSVAVADGQSPSSSHSALLQDQV